MAYGKRHKTNGMGKRRQMRGRWSFDKRATKKTRRAEDRSTTQERE